MKTKKTNAKNVVKHLRNFTDFIEKQDKEGKDYVAMALNDLWNDMLMSDFFGTEGQCDPRGDHRD